MWNWIRRIWRGYVSRRREPQLAFRVSPEEKELVEFWAQRHGTTVSDWLRDLVSQAIPTEERRKFEARYQIGEALAFSDQMMEAEEGPRLLLPEPEDTTDSEPPVQHLPKNHSCRFLDDQAFPHFYDAASCFGTCDHKQQRGRPCFWPMATAHQCTYFRLSKHPTKNKDRA